jgi:hypothetical protein
MLLFKRTRKENPIGDKMQLRISGKWKAFKERIATYLQHKSELLSVQTKRYSLIFFCLLFGGSSIAIVIHSATTEQQTVSITKISKPAHSIQDEKLYLQVDSAITKSEYERVEQFRNYLLQLNTDSSGKKKFDSIIQARPQLMDSINLFEKMYLQQK